MGKISTTLERFSEGELFLFDQLGIDPEEYPAAVKALGRMVNAGHLRRAAAGKYYKPQVSVFGELGLNEAQLLRPYLFSGQRRLAYITGEALYNRMGLTTQVPGTIKVASREKRVITKVNSLVVKPVKSYVDVTEENFILLETLDAIKDFKIIPDLDRESALLLLEQRIRGLDDLRIQQLINISLKYPPRARALLGAILDKLRVDPGLTLPLTKSLNPLSTYKLGIKEEELPGIAKWNIY